MAGSAVIGALRVVLGADTAAFDDGLKSASSKLDSFASGMAKAGAAIGVAVAAAAASLAVAVGHSLKQADELGKTAQKIGIPVEELSKLKYAADLSGVGLEDLSKSVTKLAKNMVEVAGGGVTSDAARAFKALGISVTDANGKLKPANDIIGEIAAKFQTFEDSAAKTALAVALFGRSGANLIPLLNAGAAGLKEMGAEAAQLGIVIDEKTAKSAEAFNDNLKRLGVVKDAIILKISAGMLPALESLSVAMVKAAKDSDLMKTISDSLSGVFKFSTEIGLTLATIISRVSAEASALFALIGTAPSLFSAFWSLLKDEEGSATKFGAALGGVVAAIANMGEVGKATDKAFADLKDKLAHLWDKPAADIESHAPETAGKIAAPIIQADKNLASTIIALQLKARVIGQEFKALAPGFVEAASGLKLFGQNANENRTTVDALSPSLQKLNTALLMVKGAQLTQEVLPPWQQYEQQIARINQLFDAGVISSTTYAEAIKKASETAGTAWNVAGASIAGSFATIANTFGQSNSAMATAAKAFAIVQAIISTYTGMAKALELPFPANLAAVATVAAQGFAFVAAIRGQTVPAIAKFAQGGSFMVPGGKSMTDNVVIPLNLAAGERVDVTPANEASRGGGVREFVMKGIRPRDFFTGEMLREAVDAFNAGSRDGYRLKFAAA